jgi:MOSC domain-containing protein YiiM
MNSPRVVSLNVGAVRTVPFNGELITTAIWKSPVQERLRLRGVNFDGDDQADRTVHGGRDKAVYAYAQEDYDFWRDNENIDVEPGLFGENLTVADIDLSACITGERWTVGTATLEIAQPRLPCFKLGLRMGDPRFPKRFQDVGRMGAYLRIIVEGDVTTGDTIAVTHRPDHDVSLGNMVSALHDAEHATRLKQVDDLPSFWQRVAYNRHT